MTNTLSHERTDTNRSEETDGQAAMLVAEYLVDLNATQAAIRAGYSAKTAEQQGLSTLQNTSVAEAVAEALGERE